MTDDNNVTPNEKEEKSFKHNKVMQVPEMFDNWFLDYSSSVILERSVPEIIDGLKPVQRRILHSMYELDDGRYNKVANIIGNTMKYHPHGDASIGDAIVQIGQKELLIDTQGNWGNILTGDRAAAARYIEARLTPFAKEVIFSPKITEWKPSYDGRNNEPVKLPVKFPLLLAQGAEGIAVTLSSKILPHNFNELIDASISYLQGEDFTILPDFPTGGKADFSKYNDGQRGGRVRSRAKISKIDNKTLVITEIPFSTTTDSVIASIIRANDAGKIKIKKIDDNTSNKVEIVIQLAANISPDKTIDGLYAFTDCEVSIAPNCCVINDKRPVFIGVSNILKISADNTVRLLKAELDIKQAELLEQILYASLERIFIENKIYRKIEECKTWESVISTIDHGLDPYKPLFYREITQDDIIKLTEIKIKKISKYDLGKEEEKLHSLEDNLSQVKHHLANIIEYTIEFFNSIKNKYGKGRERKTEIENLDSIDAVKVAATSCKLYVNREDGFAGIAIKKDEFVCDCSDIDDMIIIHNSGKYEIKKVADKVFVGQDILYINIFRKNDDRTIYNCVYQDGANGAYYVKRFPITSVTRDKEYDITNSKTGSKIIYLNVRPNGEAETIKVFLKPRPKLKKLNLEYDFKDISIKGKNTKGNLLTRHAIRKIQIKDDGISTLSARKIWFDDAVKRLNTDNRGTYLGEFESEDKIFYVLPDGSCRVINFDLTNHFDDVPVFIKKHNPLKVYTIIYFSGEKEKSYVKRFILDNTEIFTTVLDGAPQSKLLNVFDNDHPRIALTFPDNGRPQTCEIFELDVFIEPKGIAAKGKRLTEKDFDEILILSPYYPDRPGLDGETPATMEESQPDEENSDEGTETTPPSPSDIIEITIPEMPETDSENEDENSFQISLF